MRDKPKPRRDGRCFVCKKPIKIAAPRTGVNPAMYVDPFCSTGCAKSYYGTTT